MQSPQIPAALAEVVLGVTSLNDFHPRPTNIRRIPSQVTANRAVVALTAKAPSASPDFTVNADYQLVVPDDLHTIYNFNPVYKDGITGKGETIVVIEDTNVYSTGDWDRFPQPRLACRSIRRVALPRFIREAAKIRV